MPSSSLFRAALLVLLAGTPLHAQGPSKVERLGYPAATRLLIVHGDDIGAAHSANAATMAAFDFGVVNSGAVLVPAPWTAEFAAWYRAQPGADIGVHLTLTAEWQYLRWPGVRSRSEAPSLYDAEGFLPRLVEEVTRQARTAEAEQELRAQLERARELGLEPTHLDSHMFGVLAKPEIFAAYLRLAREQHLPAAIPGDLLRDTTGLGALIRPDEILVDRYVIASPRTRPEDWAAFYRDVIRNLAPGTITQIIVHLAYDDAEMRAVAARREAYGAAWRQRDLDFFTSPEAAQLLAENNVRLTTWRELGRLLR